MINTYAKAYTEVLEILKHQSTEEYSKIPQEKIDFYKNNMDKTYNYIINPNIELSKQNISKEAIQEFVNSLDILSNEDKKILLDLTPEKYIGLAERI